MNYYSVIQEDTLSEALHYALERKKVTRIRKLIAAGADVNIPDPQGYHLLTKALIMGRSDIVKILLDAGANIKHAVNERKTNVLCDVILHNDVYLVDLLINNGADVQSPNIYGFTPLMYSSYRHINIEITRALLKACASPNTLKDDKTALHIMANNWDIPKIRLMFDFNVDATLGAPIKESVGRIFDKEMRKELTPIDEIYNIICEMLDEYITGPECKEPGID
jgi:ankyrin repeat protein